MPPLNPSHQGELLDTVQSTPEAAPSSTHIGHEVEYRPPVSEFAIDASAAASAGPDS